jgi:hypothetical protein
LDVRTIGSEERFLLIVFGSFIGFNVDRTVINIREIIINGNMVHKLEHHGETYHAHGKAEDGDDVLGLVLEQVAPSGFEMVENHIFLFFY